MLGAVQDGNKFNLSWWKILGDGRAAWGSSSWTDLCWANRNGLGHHLERNSAASHWCFKISTYGWEKCYELLSWLSVYKRDCLIGIYDLFLFLGMSWITCWNSSKRKSLPTYCWYQCTLAAHYGGRGRKNCPFSSW